MTCVTCQHSISPNTTITTILSCFMVENHKFVDNLFFCHRVKYLNDEEQCDIQNVRFDGINAIKGRIFVCLDLKESYYS